VKSLGFFILMILVVAFCRDENVRGISQEKKDLAAIEKEMAERPREAISIARRGATAFPGDEKQLYAWAVNQQEKYLAELSLAQALELVEVCENKLEDPQAGRRVRINWVTTHAPGASQDEVRRLLGSPQRNSFQIVYRRQLEQWIYEQPVPASLTFSCTKGQIQRLQTVQSTLLKKS
jgi:hypothetical protein